jgi:hypothetical protein
MMCLYSLLLLLLNRRELPAAIRIRFVRAGVLVWSTLFFGVLAVLTIWQQIERITR